MFLLDGADEDVVAHIDFIGEFLGVNYVCRGGNLEFVCGSFAEEVRILALCEGCFLYLVTVYTISVVENLHSVIVCAR